MGVEALKLGVQVAEEMLNGLWSDSRLVQQCPSRACACHMASHDPVQNNFIHAQLFSREILDFDVAVSAIHLRKRVVKNSDVKFACCNIAVLKPHLPFLECTLALNV